MPLAAARIIAADIKLAHSVFALPFALLGACMAAVPVGEGTLDWRRLGGQLALVTAAMISARTVAMLSNRLLDRHIDARNPRTAGRALPSGRLSPATAGAVLAGAGAAFLAVCVAFGALYGNWWPAVLGVPVLGWISAYALLKRWSVLCHLYLGSSLAISPLAAALAIEPAAILEQAGLWLLAAVVLCWVAGFDVIYALQDMAVDRREGLHSIPGRLGVTGALGASRLLHLLAAAALVGVATVDPRLGVIFACAVLVTIALLVAEHATVARWGTTRLSLAFFTLNGVISCIVGVAGIWDVVH